MKTYSIPITWTSCKRYDVEAETLQEALALALATFLREPDDNYLEGFEVDDIGLREDYPEEEYDVADAVQNLPPEHPYEPKK
jgi:hypothetical protein